jgi:hypothetical protein
MTVVRRHILDASSDNKQPAVTDTPGDEPMDSRNALSSHLSQSRGSEAAYRAAQADVMGIQSTAGAAGFGVSGNEWDRGLSREGTVPADSNTQSADAIGDEGPLVQRGHLPDDSNLQAGGRAAGI